MKKDDRSRLIAAVLSNRMDLSFLKRLSITPMLTTQAVAYYQAHGYKYDRQALRKRLQRMSNLRLITHMRVKAEGKTGNGAIWIGVWHLTQSGRQIVLDYVGESNRPTVYPDPQSHSGVLAHVGGTAIAEVLANLTHLKLHQTVEPPAPDLPWSGWEGQKPGGKPLRSLPPLVTLRIGRREWTILLDWARHGSRIDDTRLELYGRVTAHYDAAVVVGWDMEKGRDYPVNGPDMRMRIVYVRDARAAAETILEIVQRLDREYEATELHQRLHAIRHRERLERQEQQARQRAEEEYHLAMPHYEEEMAAYRAVQEDHRQRITAWEQARARWITQSELSDGMKWVLSHGTRRNREELETEYARQNPWPVLKLKEPTMPVLPEHMKAPR